MIVGILNGKEKNGRTIVIIETHEKGEEDLLKQNTKKLLRNLGGVFGKDLAEGFSISYGNYSSNYKNGGGHRSLSIKHNPQEKPMVKSKVVEEALKLPGMDLSETLKEAD